MSKSAPQHRSDAESIALGTLSLQFRLKEAGDLGVHVCVKASPIKAVLISTKGRWTNEAAWGEECKVRCTCDDMKLGALTQTSLNYACIAFGRNEGVGTATPELDGYRHLSQALRREREA